jgi:L-fuconolactonase
VRFVVDHLAKPPLRGGDLIAWAEGLKTIARLPNVTCKLSGLVTETDSPRQVPVSCAERSTGSAPTAACSDRTGRSAYSRQSTATSLASLLAALGGLGERERADVIGGTAMRTYWRAKRDHDIYAVVSSSEISSASSSSESAARIGSV